MGLFKKDSRSAMHPAQTASRPSRGWGELREHLKNGETLRVLDFGATSPSNINYLTTLGHSVYMSNIVEEATRPEWFTQLPPDAAKGTAPEFDVERFVAANLDFSGREFDVILLWDTANYLPPEVVPALFRRLRDVLRPDGRLLALFHGQLDAPNPAFFRYQLTDKDDLVLLECGDFPMRQVYQTRQIEKFLEGYSSFRFFLGKDNVREVLAVR